MGWLYHIEFKSNVYIKVCAEHLPWQESSSLSALATKLFIFICLDKELAGITRWISWQLRTSILKHFNKIGKPHEHSQDTFLICTNLCIWYPQWGRGWVRVQVELAQLSLLWAVLCFCCCDMRAKGWCWSCFGQSLLPLTQVHSISIQVLLKAASAVGTAESKLSFRCPAGDFKSELCVRGLLCSLHLQECSPSCCPMPGRKNPWSLWYNDCLILSPSIVIMGIIQK